MILVIWVSVGEDWKVDMQFQILSTHLAYSPTGSNNPPAFFALSLMQKIDCPIIRKTFEDICQYRENRNFENTLL